MDSKARKPCSTSGESPNLSTTTAVYFVVGGGRTKIGLSRRPELRVRTLQVGSPVELRLVGWFGATWRDEQLLHEAYADRCAWGEWFDGEWSAADVEASRAWLESVRGTLPEYTDAGSRHRLQAVEHEGGGVGRYFGEKPDCSVEGCSNTARTRGMCAAHYARWYRTGSAVRRV